MPEPTREEAAALYDEDDRALVRTIVASKTPGVPRVEEIIALAKEQGLARIGVAYCVGADDEAEQLGALLAPHFEVTMVGCKVGGLQNEDLVEGATGAACNPAGQAKVLNDADTQLNIMLCLCLGHDMIFHKHSAAPVTVLGVKDRVHNHNAIEALR